MADDIGLAAALDAAKDTREYRAGIAFDVPADGLEQYTAAVIRAAAPIIARQVAEQIAERIDEDCPHEPDVHPEGCCEVCDFAFAAGVIAREVGSDG